MTTTQHTDTPEAAPGNDFDDELLAEFANLVETCLAHREDVQPMLTEIRQQMLRGQAVQEQLDDLLTTEPTLRVVGMAAHNDDLDDLLAAAEAVDALSTEQVEMFEAFWSRNEWITPGVVAHRKQKAHESTYWTDASLDCLRRDGLLYVRHQFEWGLDEVHTVEAPLDVAWNDLLNRLRAILIKLGDDDVELKTTEQEFLKGSQRVLEQIHGHLDATDLPDDTEEGAADDAEDGLGDGNSLARLFGDDEAEVEDDEEDEDEVDESLIGFA